MGSLLYKWAPFCARLLFVPLFVYSGLRKLLDPNTTAGYIQETFIRNLGIGVAAPGETGWLLMAYGALVVELGAAALLLVGWQTRLASLGLFVYLAIVSFVFHAMGWLQAPDAAAATMQALSLFKNLAIMGGLLLLGTYGPGRPSVEVKH